MSFLLALVPLVALLALWVLLSDVSPEHSLARTFLRAYLLWLAWIVLATEALSLLHALTRTGLTVWWLVTIVLIGSLLGWRARLRRLRTVRLRFPDGWADRFVLTGILVVLLATLVVAIVAPPQTWDSLNYHMARVAHWAQAQSVAHFATGIEKQDAFPPAAEYQILNFYLLASGDRFANLPQWLALVVAALAAGSCGQLLGLPRAGQILSAAFVVSLPMGIAQASSTMNDLAVAAVSAACAVEALAAWKGDLSPGTFAFAGLSAGLAILTKGTAVAFVAPFGVLLAAAALRSGGLRRSVGWLSLAAVLALAPSAGVWLRNLRTFGHPLGSRHLIVSHSNENLSPAAIASNLARGATLHLWTSSAIVNEKLEDIVLGLHSLLGLSANDPRTTCCSTFEIRTPTRHEDLVGNPIHLLAAVLSLALLAASRRRPRGGVAHALACAGAVLLFAALFKWQIYGSRLQTGLFVLAGPVVAGAAGVVDRRWPSQAAAIVLLLACTPWLTGIPSRPLYRPTAEGPESIFGMDRTTLLFANGPYLRAPYEAMVREISASSCSDVGLMLAGNAAEYPLWYLLGAPREGLRIEWIVADSPVAVHTPADFAPCAVICEDCAPDQTIMRGLPRTDVEGSFQLFLKVSSDGG